MVRIDKWELTSRYPEGHFIHTIGLIGNIEVIRVGDCTWGLCVGEGRTVCGDCVWGKGGLYVGEGRTVCGGEGRTVRGIHGIQVCVVYVNLVLSVSLSIL